MTLKTGLTMEKTTGSIVCTIAAEIVHIKNYNSARPTDGSIVEQKKRELFEQKNTIPNKLNSYNFAANDFDYTTSSKHQKPVL